ncbi:unnamed protein product [Calypogeia fissa]
MDFYVQKAKLFAFETAKRSQEIATQAAKISQELATETAKRSKELATETAKLSKELAIDVTKRADQLKAYAGDLTPGVPRGPAAPPQPSEEELEEYGITQELREFAKGLTIKTFKDFPIDGPDGGFRAETGSETGKQDLTAWRERHAVLVLSSVKEISDFRYVLCPRRMKETRFWRIYFTLVKSQISGAEARALEKEVALAREKEIKLLSQRGETVEELERDSRPPPPYPGDQGVKVKAGGDPSSAKHADDLDAYLLGALDSSDEGNDGDDDDGFDADFDQLVNSAVDSDGEDEASQTDSNNDNQKTDQSMPSSTSKPSATSEVSSDGELVEIPDSETEQTSRSSVAENPL